MVQGISKQTGAKEKWEKYALRVNTNTSSKVATFKLTAQKTFELLGDRRGGLLLDIGCGFGEIDLLLAKQTNFFITGCDISAICIKRAHKAVEKAGMSPRIKIEYGDVYNLPYADRSFDVVTSFGYASAATYKGAQNEICRVLKPKGLLICDFINVFSGYKIFKIISAWKKIRNRDAKEYNFLTKGGITNYFMRYGLEFKDQVFFNSFPPVNFFPKEQLLFFEKTIGRIFNRFLGRVRLVCFMRK